MYEQTNTMMETKTTFQIPQLLDGDDFTSEDLADDMEGLRLSFTRIKIPGGGHLQFEIPSGNPDVPDYAPYLEGVILYSHNSNAYWPEGSEYDDDQPPLCQSFDGKVGYDIAAIGYLHAVQRYFTEKSLHRYRFSTIAWRSMNSSLNTFRRQEQRRQSHEFSYQAAHPPPDDAFDALRARLLLHDLFLLADEEQTLLVRHRLHGCSLAETARMEGMSVKRVRHRLKALYRAYFAQKETKQKEL